MQDALAGLPRVKVNLRSVRFSGSKVTVTQKRIRSLWLTSNVLILLHLYGFYVRVRRVDFQCMAIRSGKWWHHQVVEPVNCTSCWWTNFLLPSNYFIKWLPMKSFRQCHQVSYIAALVEQIKWVSQAGGKLDDSIFAALQMGIVYILHYGLHNKQRRVFQLTWRE